MRGTACCGGSGGEGGRRAFPEVRREEKLVSLRVGRDDTPGRACQSTAQLGGLRGGDDAGTGGAAWRSVAAVAKLRACRRAQHVRAELTMATALWPEDLEKGVLAGRGHEGRGVTCSAWMWLS